MNGRPIGLTDDIPREGCAFEGPFPDVLRACEKFIEERCPKKGSKSFTFSDKAPFQGVRK